MSVHLRSKHRRFLRVSAPASRLIILLITIIASSSPLFDSSPRVSLQNSTWTSPLLRWDAFYFAHIAKNNYVYEHEWAFFPGTPFIMKYTGSFLGNDGWAAVLQGGALVALLCDTTFVLYDLTLHHLRSESLAFLVSLLSLMPSSPATLRFAPYTEPFFTYLSYHGMLRCARSQWFTAAVCFCLAGTFRSNGTMLSGFIIWGLLVEPLIQRKMFSLWRFPYALLLTAITCTPFLYHQYSAYQSFCKDSANPALWCTKFPPMIYTYVQSKYWNVGFLRYWTISQIPNFILAAPILLLLSSFSVYHISKVAIGFFNTKPPASSPFLSVSLTPHAIHAFIFTMMLLFASHTQIILRLAASMPFTYWAAAWLLVEHPKWGKWWVGWSIIWGCVSLVLWAVFLPPA